MVAQLTYEETPAIGFNGMLAQEFALRQVDSGLVENVTISLGAAVKYGTADGQYLGALVDEAVVGVVLFSGSSEKQADGAFVYSQKDQFPVLSKGRYYAVALGTTVIGDELAYYPATKDVGPVSAGNSTLAFAKAMSSGSAGDIILVEVSFA